MRSLRHSQKGFTVLELMIATAVVSVVLLMVSVIMINIGNLYYKGITQSKIQDNTRSITDDVAQRISLSSAIPKWLNSTDGNLHAVCIGDTRYTYILGKQIKKAPSSLQTRHALWRDTVSAGSCPTPDTANLVLMPANDIDTAALIGGGAPAYGQVYQGTNGSELLSPNSRLSNFEVRGLGPLNTAPYQVVVDIAYGDDDLLCSNSIVTNTCNDTAASVTPAEIASRKLSCKGKAGDSYCATANLTTVAVPRLQ
ncbi:MAG: prepilin-type N-terminal cleavage/methylation domain-containing protein [Patescibacteria group bacterium]